MSRIHSIRATLALTLLSLNYPVFAQKVEDATELEEVVVTASPIGDPDHLATIAGSVDRDQLLRSGGNHPGRRA